MPIIKSVTKIEAPRERCFELARSIDLHKISTEHTSEEAIAGITSGLIGLNESVTWKAKHLGITQSLKVRITEFNKPNFFVDEMENGAFKRFRHEHHFEVDGNGTSMIDYFDYDSPFGFIGKVVNFIFLNKYMNKFLTKRNSIIKRYAETDNWKSVIKEN